MQELANNIYATWELLNDGIAIEGCTEGHLFWNGKEFAKIGYNNGTVATVEITTEI